MLLLCYITLPIPEPSITFSILHDHVTYDYDRCPASILLCLYDYHMWHLLLFICLAYVSLHVLFVFNITFFSSGLISLHKIGLYISLCHNCSTDIQNIVVVFYEDWVITVLSAAALVLVPRSTNITYYLTISVRIEDNKLECFSFSFIYLST